MPHFARFDDVALLNATISPRYAARLSYAAPARTRAMRYARGAAMLPCCWRRRYNDERVDIVVAARLRPLITLMFCRY